MSGTAETRPLRRTAMVAAIALLFGLLPLGGPAGAQFPDAPDDFPFPGGDEDENGDENGDGDGDPDPDADHSGQVRRLAGENRFATAAEVAADAFPDGAGTVVLALGDAFPDALAGAFLAGAEDAPILLTSTDSIPPPTEEALVALSANSVVILGGTAAISSAVEASLEADGYEVRRVGGVSRYDTARLIAQSGPAAGVFRASDDEVSGRATALLATGENFADALAAGPFAFADSYPIVLTATAALSPEAEEALTDERLAIERVIIIGGQRAVSDEVEQEVVNLGFDVIRVFGNDRNETAVELASLLSRPQSSDPRDDPEWPSEEVNIALGQQFPDALALGPRGGRTRSAVVLAQTPRLLGDATSRYLSDHCTDIATVVLAGGTAALDEDVESQARFAASCGFLDDFDLHVRHPVALYGEEQAVTVTLTDDLGRPVPGVPIKIEVYRGGLQAQAGLPEEFRDLNDLNNPAESTSGETNAQGQVRLSYTVATEGDEEPDEDLAERIVACSPPSGSPFPCTVHLREGSPGDDRMAIWAAEGFRVDLDGDLTAPQEEADEDDFVTTAENHEGDGGDGEPDGENGDGENGEPEPEPEPQPDPDPGQDLERRQETGEPGAEEASGTAVIWFPLIDEDDENAEPELCFSIQVRGLDPPANSSRVYKSLPDGDVALVTLDPPPDARGETTGCAEEDDYLRGVRSSKVIGDMKAKPDEYYLLITNSEYPDGALRGDLG